MALVLLEKQELLVLLERQEARGLQELLARWEAQELQELEPQVPLDSSEELAPLDYLGMMALQGLLVKWVVQVLLDSSVVQAPLVLVQRVLLDQQVLLVR